MIGLSIILLRWRASFAGAVAFAILLGNICGPLFDLAAAELSKRKKKTLPVNKGSSA